MSVTIYHNPRCSKSRATLALLAENNIRPTIVEYLKNPPTASELKDILGKLGLSAADLLRPKEAAEAGVNAAALTDDELIAAMVASPQVMERPIVLANGKARIGRPPERVLEIL